MINILYVCFVSYNFINELGNTALHRAADQGRQEIAKLLIDLKEMINGEICDLNVFLQRVYGSMLLFMN